MDRSTRWRICSSIRSSRRPASGRKSSIRPRGGCACPTSRRASARPSPRSRACSPGWVSTVSRYCARPPTRRHRWTPCWRRARRRRLDARARSRPLHLDAWRAVLEERGGLVRYLVVVDALVDPVGLLGSIAEWKDGLALRRPAAIPPRRKGQLDRVVSIGLDDEGRHARDLPGIGRHLVAER